MSALVVSSRWPRATLAASSYAFPAAASALRPGVWMFVIPDCALPMRLAEAGLRHGELVAIGERDPIGSHCPMLGKR
jgi:hypothetical protein